MPVEFSCSQCGGSARLVVDPATSIRDVILRIEDAHAAKNPECPLRRDHIIVTVPA